MDTKRATSREIQRSIFSNSLFRELEAMENVAESRNADLVAKAAQYREDGLEPDEVVDMLILDGFPAELCRSHVEMGRMANAGGEGWDFLYEDAYGVVWRGSEIGMTVGAESKEDAIVVAQARLSNAGILFERVVDAERISED